MNKNEPIEPERPAVSGAAPCSPRCRLCGKTVHEIGGYLHRVNAKGVAGVWECRPSCNAAMTFDDRLIAAIEGEENARAQQP